MYESCAVWCVFRGTLVFMDDQAYQEEKVNRYDSYLW